MQAEFLITYFFNSHRHSRFALFFHSLALIACVRNDRGPQTERYLNQVSLNQAFLRTWAGSTVNVGHWLVLVVRYSAFPAMPLAAMVDSLPGC